ncbi:MAG: calcium-translocating P-type ATPase, PMCA-type [Candidatus Odinarchaeota archaeon]
MSIENSLTANHYYDVTDDEALNLLNTSREGLSEQEALERVKLFGSNQLEEAEKKTILDLFIQQFNDVLIWILIAAAIISILDSEWEETLLIAVILIINSIFGVYQEWKADKALDALKAMAAATCKVLRGGKELELPSEELVPGDIILLETGDRVPADGRLVEDFNFRVEESSLTGESLEVEKSSKLVFPRKTTLQDRKNLVFMGTFVTFGRGKAVITSTGMRTEMGKIAESVQSIDASRTPFQVKLDRFGKKLSVFIIVFAMAIVLVGAIFRGEELFNMIKIGVSIAVAAIPEGLPIIITLTLALGVQRMAKFRAIVKRLPTVESLGSTTVICTDKTGTLTMNQMTVVETVYYTADGLNSITQDGEISENPPENVQKLYQSAVFCNNASLDGEEPIGDPTELALLREARRHGFLEGELASRATRTDEEPFDSERKRMVVAVQREEGGKVAYMKGAPEVLLELCSSIDTGEGIRSLDEKIRAEIEKQIEMMAARALRVLAFSYAEIDGEYGSLTEVETSTVFCGLMGMIDPPKPGVVEAVQSARDAGIRVIMVTGDHKNTAKAIARDIGIGTAEEIPITGEELEQMSEDELAERIKITSIFARISPFHKLAIVRVLKKNGEIVAMTGDGINDAIALKGADVGIAMGIAGTDVTKETADIVLADDNFATIIEAVREGRDIYDHMFKFVKYMLSSNFAEILVVFLALLFSWPVPLIAVQILWINLVTDGPPALAMSTLNAEDDVMKRPPRDPREPLLGKDMGLFIIRIAFYITLASLLAFYLGDFNNNYLLASTLAFATLSVVQLFNAFNLSTTSKRVINRTILDNKILLAAVLGSFLLQFLIIQGDQLGQLITGRQTSVLGDLFHTVPLTVELWLLVLLLGIGVNLFEEIFRLFVRKKGTTSS